MMAKGSHFKGLLFLLGGLLFGIGLGAVVLFSGPSASAGPKERRLPPTVGSAARDFSLPLLDERDGDGAVITLNALKGQPVVINFWATWCPPCKEEMPLLERYATEYKGQMTVLGVDYAEDEALVRAFVEEQRITFPILLDHDGVVSDLYYVRNYPTTFFVDAEGVLRAQHLGMLTEERMVKYLETIGIQP